MHEDTPSLVFIEDTPFLVFYFSFANSQLSSPIFPNCPLLSSSVFSSPVFPSCSLLSSPVLSFFSFSFHSSSFPSLCNTACLHDFMSPCLLVSLSPCLHVFMS